MGANIYGEWADGPSGEWSEFHSLDYSPVRYGGEWGESGRMGHRANGANFIRWIIRPYDMGAPGANRGGWAWYAVGGSDVEDTRLHIT